MSINPGSIKFIIMYSKGVHMATPIAPVTNIFLNIWPKEMNPPFAFLASSPDFTMSRMKMISNIDLELKKSALFAK